MNKIEINKEYFVKGLEPRAFVVLGTIDRKYILDGGDKIKVLDVQVTGWNTRVIFQVVEVPHVSLRNKKTLPYEKLCGLIDFKNDEPNELSGEIENVFVMY